MVFQIHTVIFSVVRSLLVKKKPGNICPPWKTHIYVVEHYKNPTNHVGLAQSGPHHHLIEN